MTTEYVTLVELVGTPIGTVYKYEGMAGLYYPDGMFDSPMLEDWMIGDLIDRGIIAVHKAQNPEIDRWIQENVVKSTEPK